MAEHITGDAQQDSGRGWRWVLLVLVGLPVLAVGGCFALLSSGGGDDEWEPTSSEASSICKGFVKDRLKSPSTADFSAIDASVGSGIHAYVVTGAVDSQNSFGAMVRNSFRCALHFAEAEEKWRLDDLAFSGR